jgi:DNA-3-methyladenine glycosylase II
MWARRPGFATLLRIVFEQQVSLASADAAFTRLQRAVGRVTAQRVARLSLTELRRWGITRQKADYCLNLARLIVSGALNLRTIARADDATARQALLEVRGIGPWTADIYLLMALRRPDVWPDGDLALAGAVKQVKRLRTHPPNDRLQRIAVAWKPWRSVAARILWHHYLSERRAR